MNQTGIDWLFVLFICWASASLVGLLTLFVIAVRQRSLTLDDLPVRLRKAVGLIVFSPGPFGLAYVLATQTISSVGTWTWFGIALKTTLFLFILLSRNRTPWLTFDRKLREKMNRKK